MKKVLPDSFGKREMHSILTSYSIRYIVKTTLF